MKNKKKKGLAAGASAMIAAVALLIASNGSSIEGTYEITNINPYESEMRISTPTEFKPDIAVLKLNDMEVTKILLPNGVISTYPLVISQPERLSMDMYIRGEKAATASFEENGILKIELNKAAVDKAKSGEGMANAN